MTTSRFRFFIPYAILLLAGCGSANSRSDDAQAMIERQDELEERLNSVEEVQANLVNQMATSESASSSDSGASSNAGQVSQDSDWQQQHERDEMKRDIENLRIQQQADSAQRYADKAFRKPVQ